MSIGEALLSNVLPVLLEKLASPVVSELGKLYGVKDEIAKLRRTVERLQAMLHDAEQKKLVEGQGDMLWLREIKTTLHAAEDLVDEIEYEGLRCEVMKSSADGRRHGADGNCLVSFMSEKLCKFCSRLTPHVVSFRCQMAHKIGDLRRKLDEISKEKKDFKLDGMSGSKANLSEIDRPAETTALLGTPKVFGRDEVKNNRLANVADILHPKKIELKDLSFPDSWSIFETYAFGDAHSPNYQILESIGMEIVKKLKGVPLAISVIGGLLGSESDERRWRDVLDSKLWELEQGGHGILPALKLSYEFLPYHLKKCFIYCCVWPKNRHFSVYELVQLWMAQDFVRPQGNRCMEDVGVDCIKELLNRSLIQVVYDGYMIHDLLHDLGQQILEQEYYRIGPEPDQVQKLPKDAQSKVHLVASYSEAPGNMREILYEFKSLRTLAFWPGSAPYKLQIDLFHIVKGLRVFDICGSSIDALPVSISYLKHLRYLDLRFTNIECLPETLCSLYFLQTLRLQGCDKLKSLPSGMSNLVNLHYLEARTELVSNIAQIWKLIHLQYLEVFSVSEENRNRLGDLKNMRELRGRLCIQNLERVKTREVAADATILKNMQYLKSLELRWGDGQNVNQTCNYPAVSIIQFLQPPQHLKKLIIKSYAGTNFPSWMNNVSIPVLEHLYLHNCTNLNPFSPLGQLHFLKTLHIIGCPQLKELSQLPPALENLILQEVGLVVLSGRLHHLPLQRVILCQIPELKQLPVLPFTLRELTIEDVGLQALPELISQGCGVSVTITTTTTTTTRGSYIDEDKSNDYLGEPALSTLKIHNCPHLTTLDGGLLKQQHLRHLKVLSIKRCWELVNWPEGGGFQSTLYSLADELSIESCPTLAEFPEGTRLSLSLKKLVVKGSPMVPNRLMLGQVHNVDDVDVDMDYSNLEQCANEALQHILVVEQLTIAYFQVDDDVGLGAESFVALTYKCIGFSSNGEMYGSTGGAWDCAGKKKKKGWRMSTGGSLRR
ncbi:hypothetical protein Taro_034697 [Colocasia esculenta]|uniref:Uncharacterized protein n=1 Tax=Colocasia esculenta TaxID=4460 RepID=A0A843WAU2_COLES|nr:hypothetical protein [Colocasia esculenta]